MVLSNDPPFLFIHVPKTAGSSIEESLFHHQSFEYSRVTHGISLQYKNYLNDDYYFDLFRFGFVRNPWDLQVSCWRYYIRNWDISMTFDEYIEWKFNGSIVDMLDRIPEEFHGNREGLLSNAFYIHRAPQTFYFIDESGNFLVNYIGNFENINSDYSEICKLASIDDDFLPHTNSSLRDNENREYKKHYNQKTKEIIRSRFAMDILIFGYEFDNIKPTKPLKLLKPNSSISDYGYVIPMDFYFSPFDITYGMGGIKNIYEEEPEETWVARKKEFVGDMAHRRISSLENNIQSINQRIFELEDFVVENDSRTTIFEQSTREIQSLQERRLVYKMEIKKMKELYQKLESNDWDSSQDK